MIETAHMDCRLCGKRGFYAVEDPVCGPCAARRSQEAFGPSSNDDGEDPDLIESALHENEKIRAEEEFGWRMPSLRKRWV